MSETPPITVKSKRGRKPSISKRLSCSYRMRTDRIIQLESLAVDRKERGVRPYSRCAVLEDLINHASLQMVSNVL